MPVIRESLKNLSSELNQIKQERNKIEACYDAISDRTTCLITRQNLEGVVLDVSQACERLLGYEAEELIGRSIYQLFHPEALPDFQKLYATLEDKPVTWTFCHRFQRKDGDYIWVENTSKIIRDTNTENLLELLWFSNDITERYQTETELKQNKKIIQKIYKITSISKEKLKMQ